MWVSRLTNTFDTVPVPSFEPPAVLFATWQLAQDPVSWADKKSVQAVKKFLTAFSPAIWEEGYKRGREGILGMSAVVLEFEDGSRIEDVLELFVPWKFYFYTSFQHRADAPRFRLVLPFEQPLPVEEHQRAWDAAAALCRGRGYEPDPTCREPSRLYYLPTYTPSRATEHSALSWEEPAAWYRPPVAATAPKPLLVPRAGSDVMLTWAVTGRADVAMLDEACAFSRHARDDAATLPEPEWRAALSLWLRCQDGVELAHARSQPYEGYTRSETDAKLAVLQEAGVLSCATIRNLSAACRGCTQTCANAIELATPAPATPEPEERKPITAEQADAWVQRALSREQTATAAQAAATEHLRRIKSAGSPDELRTASMNKVAADQEVRAAKVEVRAAERAKRQTLALTTAPVPAPPGADKAVWDALSFDLRAMAPKATKGNVRLILTRDSKYAGKYRWNEFTMYPTFDKKEAADTHDTDTATDLEYRYNLAVPTAYIREVSVAVAMESPYHPVRDWLGSLSWDGIDRLSTLLDHGFGAVPNRADPDIMAELSAIFLISVVARIFVPGEKVDTMLILTGRQNVAKSSALRALVSPPGYAPRLGWFGDAKLRNLGDKDTAQLLLGKLLWEIGELGSSWRNADARDRKQWLSQQEDRYRPPYGHRPVDVPRQCVVVGTTNDEVFLTDPTGNRRYLCVAVGAVNLEWIKANRDQLFAQAVVEYNAGRRYWVDAEFQVRLERHNARFAEVDLWVAVIESWLRKHNKKRVTLEQVLTQSLGMDAIAAAPKDVTRARDVLRVIGCVSDRPEDGKGSGWIVPDTLLTLGEREVTHYKDNVVPISGRTKQQTG